MTKSAFDIRRMTVSALLLAAALILRAASFTLPVAGAPVIRVSFSGPFAQFPAVAFGPVFGGVVFGLLDVISFVWHPTGGYIPWITVNMALQGVLTGLLWKKMEKLRETAVSGALFCVFGAAALYGGVNLVLTRALPGCAYIGWLSGIGAKTLFATAGLMIVGVVGIVTLLIGRRMSPLFNKLLFSAGIPSLLASTVNTYILRAYMLTSDKPFLLLWLPKIAEASAIMFYNAYVLVILVKIYEIARTKVKALN